MHEKVVVTMNGTVCMVMSKFWLEERGAGGGGLVVCRPVRDG